MADGKNDDVELEAMLKDSFSWHPCQVSLRSTGLGLILQYGDDNVEEMIADKEGVLARIRVRSTPLQGDDCSSIQQGDHVLATHDTRVKGIFYDARVEEAVRVRHSKRTHCRCSFTIKWLHQTPEGRALTVPASAIMKLARKNINSHPTISTFFSMLESPSSSVIDTMPFSTTVDGVDWEMDIDVLLERQIQEINNASDVSRKHFAFGLKVDLEEQSRGRAIDASLKEPCAITPLFSNLMQYTGSDKHQMETAAESPPASIPEEIIRSKTSLNPLAARAALASLRSKFPRSAELSAESNMEKEQITNEYDLSVKTKDPKYEGIVKKLFPIPKFSLIAESSNAPSRAQAKGLGKKNKNSEKKTVHPTEVRLTRARTQGNSALHESIEMTDTKDMQLGSSSRTRRFTRSTVDGSEKNEANAATEEDLLTNTSTQNTATQQKCLSENKKPVVSPIDSKMSTPSAEIEKSLLEKDGKTIKLDSRKGTFVEEAQKQNLPKRLTRSAAREEAEESNSQPKLKFRKRNICQSKELNLSEGNVTPESSTVEFEKSFSSPDAANISAPFTEEKLKKGEKLTSIKTTPNSSESNVSSSQGTKKSAVSKKQETRFSPRLKFLPRTRSQRKT